MLEIKDFGFSFSLLHFIRWWCLGSNCVNLQWLVLVRSDVNCRGFKTNFVSTVRRWVIILKRFYEHFSEHSLMVWYANCSEVWGKAAGRESCGQVSWSWRWVYSRKGYVASSSYRLGPSANLNVCTCICCICKVLYPSSILLNVFDLCLTGYFCPALSIAVKTMKKEEKALLTVKPQCKCPLYNASVIWFWIIVEIDSNNISM